VKRLVLLALLASLAWTEARAGESIGGACPAGADTISNGVALKCVSSAWVTNSIQIGNDAATCDSGKAGSIRYASGSVEVCNGSAWGAVGGSGALDSLSDVTLTSATANDVLLYNGSAWVDMPLSTAMLTTTMMANWPDAIQCNFTTPAWGKTTLIAKYMPFTPTGHYTYADAYGTSIFRLGYNASGSQTESLYYNGSAWSTAISDCTGQTMTQNYAAGRAFNFIGTGAVTTFDAGTASAPGLAVTSDINTGLWSPGADTFSISTDGTERLRIDSSGKVGIGTASPAANLHISSTGSALRISDSDTANGGALGAYVEFRDSAAAQSGYLGFGGTAIFDIWNTTVTPMRFATSNAERMRIDSSGNVIVGATSFAAGGTNIQFNAAGYIQTSRATSAAASQIIFNNTVGAVGSISTINSTTAYNTTSDYRLKEHVRRLTGALEKVMQLRPSLFNFKRDPSRTEISGFIAHEVQSIVPEAVTGAKDAVDKDGAPVYQQMDASKLVPTLTAAIQELKISNDNQEAALKALEAKFDAYEATHP
jgi:hypothetical protein